MRLKNFENSRLKVENFQKIVSITRTIFSHSMSEQNTIFAIIFKLKIMPVAPPNLGTAAAAAGVARFLQSFSHGRSNPRFHFPSLTHALAHQLTGYCTCTGVLFTQYLILYHVLLRHYRDSNLGIIKDGLNSNIIFISLPTLQKKVSKQEKKFLILLRLE